MKAFESNRTVLMITDGGFTRQQVINPGRGIQALLLNMELTLSKVADSFRCHAVLSFSLICSHCLLLGCPSARGTFVASTIATQVQEPILQAVESSVLWKVGVSLHARPHDTPGRVLNISLIMQLLGFDQLKRSCPVPLRSFLLPVFGGGRKCRCDENNRSLILRSLKLSLFCMLRCHLLRKGHSKTVPAVVSCSIKSD